VLGGYSKCISDLDCKATFTGAYLYRVHMFVIHVRNTCCNYVYTCVPVLRTYARANIEQFGIFRVVSIIYFI